MRDLLRQTAFVGTAIVGLSTASAIAASPSTGTTEASPTMAPPPAGATASPPASAGMASGASSSADTAVAAPDASKMQARVEQRIADLQAKLQISPAQKPQWDHFTQVMRENARDMDAAFQARIRAMDTMTAEANMKSYADITTHHARDMQRLLPAFDALYAKMSDSQKKTADQVFRDEANQGDRGKNG